MEAITLHPILFYSNLVFMAMLAIACVYIFFMWWAIKKKDVVILIDKSNRWRIIYTNLMGADKLKHEGKYYVLLDKCSILNKKGKALFIFSENKPTPLKVNYNENEWMTSESLMATINNELIKLMVQPRTKLQDMLIMFGALGGIIAGVASCIILAKQFGLIT